MHGQTSRPLAIREAKIDFLMNSWKSLSLIEEFIEQKGDALDGRSSSRRVLIISGKYTEIALV